MTREWWACAQSQHCCSCSSHCTVVTLELAYCHDSIEVNLRAFTEYPHIMYVDRPRPSGPTSSIDACLLTKASESTRSVKSNGSLANACRDLALLSLRSCAVFIMQTAHQNHAKTPIPSTDVDIILTPRASSIQTKEALHRR